MAVRLYNTLTKQIEEFKPIIPGKMGFYSCGPTVYWTQHLGNMRTFISNDIIKRVFMANGYDVTHVMNLTDVGHLTSDADTGEDKMEKGAKREGKTAWEVAEFYGAAFKADLAELNILPPTFMPRATEFITEQIDMIKQLEALGYTYEIPNSGVYYDTSKFADYGALSGQDLSKLHAGARVDVEGKKNHTDFLLWAFSPADSKRDMEWESPWGIGWPGWAIECSAMGMKLLGAHFDMHTGGQEHINVHHTNEIAQSEPIVGKPWVNYWVHFAWLMAKDGKMSKSAGDALTVPYIKSLGYDPMHFRYMMLLGHYRQPMDFLFSSLDAARTGYERIVRRVSELIPPQSPQAATAPPQGGGTRLPEWREKILAPASDNFKTAEALVVFQEMLRDKDTDDATKLAVVEFADELFGLRLIEHAQALAAGGDDVPAAVKDLAEQRIAAKKARDFAAADAFRAEIDAAGWVVKDTPDGYALNRK